MKNIALLLTIALFTVNCTAQWGKRIKGNGKVVTEERSVGEYEEIAVAGWFDVDLVKGREGEISLKGEENLLEYIITEVKNGKLTIKVKKGYNLQSSNWKEGILVTVPFERISAVSLSGSGDIRSHRIQLRGSGAAADRGCRHARGAVLHEVRPARLIF